MRVGLLRFDVRFLDDLNMGRRQARTPFGDWGVSFVARPVPALGDFSMVSLIESGCVAFAFESRSRRSSSRIFRPESPISQEDSIRTAPWFCFRSPAELFLLCEAEKGVF